MALSDRGKVEVVSKESQSVVTPQLGNVFVEFDKLDIIILRKFLDNWSYSLQDMKTALIKNGYVKNIHIETLRKRFEKKYVARGYIIRIKTFGILYDLNENARPEIERIIKGFVKVFGVSDILH